MSLDRSWSLNTGFQYHLYTASWTLILVACNSCFQLSFSKVISFFHTLSYSFQQNFSLSGNPVISWKLLVIASYNSTVLCVMTWTPARHSFFIGTNIIGELGAVCVSGAREILSWPHSEAFLLTFSAFFPSFLSCLVRTRAACAFVNVLWLQERVYNL